MSDIREDTINAEESTKKGVEYIDQSSEDTKRKADGIGNVFKDPRRIAIFVVAIVVSLVLIVVGSLLVTGVIGDEGYNNTQRISISGTVYSGQSYMIDVDNSETYYRFEPTTSGYYYVYTTSYYTSLDTYGKIYDSSMSMLISDDDSGDSYNFKIRYYFTSGRTYYISVKAYSSTGTARLSIERSY